MKALRIIHAVTVLLAGLALVAALYGSLRLAIAILVLIICLQAWSLEMLRAIAGQREPRR